MVASESFKVGEWQVEPSLDRIRRAGVVRNLRPQVMAALTYLATRPGQLVSAEELLNDIWDGRVVTEGSIYNCISELRLALAIEGDAATVIETIPKKGYRLIAPVKPCDVPGAGTGTRHRIAAFFGISLLAAVVTLFWTLNSDLLNSEIRSLAVLPLDNHSTDPARDEYFVDGMTEAVITKLSQVRGLKVVSRTSAMRLKNSDLSIPEIAAMLGVDAIIEGSVLIADNEVRVTLQLIDADSDTHIWSNTYVRGLSDIVDLQDAMANSVASELSLNLSRNTDPVTQATRVITTNPDAYRAYLKGRYLFNQFGEQNFRAALNFYQDAVDLDPQFALAHASLSETCMQPIILFGNIRTLEQCETDARKAVALDGSLAEAYAALGFVNFAKWEWQLADDNLQRALALNPNSVMALQWHAATLRANHKFGPALTEFRRAEELDPLNLFVKTMVGWPLYDMHSYDEALAQWQDVLEMDANFMLAHYNEGLAYIQLHKPDDVFRAAEHVARIAGPDSLESRLLFASAHAISGNRDTSLDILRRLERDGGNHLAAWIARIHLLLGDIESALARLEKGVTERSVDMVTIFEPPFDEIRQHPRFQAVREQMGLAAPRQE